MKTTFAKAAVSRIGIGAIVTSLKAALVIGALGGTAEAGPVTIFWDDFESYALGSNPNSPPIGEPWQVSEVVPDGIDVALDMADPNNNVLWFGPYRNTAVAPFSAVDRQRIALAQNLTVSFDYYGISSGGYSNYFDVGGYDGLSGDPAFLIRIAPQENAAGSGLHNVQYLDPAGGLVDSGVDVATDHTQSVTIAADFASETYELDVEGSSATLPMFRCPSDTHDVRFANYGVAMGSGSLDNLSVTVMEPEAGADAQVPELSPIWLLVAGGLFCGCVWIVTMLKAKRPGDEKAKAERGD